MQKIKMNKIATKKIRIKIYDQPYFWLVCFMNYYLICEFVKFIGKNSSIVDLLLTIGLTILADIVVYKEIQKINKYGDFLSINDLGVAGFMGNDKVFVKWENIDKLYLDKVQIENGEKKYWFLFFELNDSYTDDVEIIIGEKDSLDQKKCIIINVDPINSKKAYKMVQKSFELFKENK